MAFFLKCNHCGNAYTCPPRQVGDKCGVGGCMGTLLYNPNVKAASNQPNAFLVECMECGNVFSSPPRKILDKCGVNKCDGRLRRKW